MSSIETSVRRCGSSVQGPRVAQLAVGVQLDLALDQLEAEVGDRDERAVRQAARRGPDGERDDRLVARRRGPPGGPGPAPRRSPSAASRARRRSRRGSRRRPSAPRGPRRGGARRRGRRCRTVGVDRPRSPAGPGRGRDVPFATTRAVRPAAITLTLPPAGRSLSASTAAAFAASSRFGVTSVACIDAEVSTTRTRSPARPAGRSMNGRAARNTRISDEQQLEQQQEAPAQPLPRRVRLDVGDEALPQQRRRHDRLVPPQLEQVHRDDERARTRARRAPAARGTASRPTRPRAGGAARRTRGRRAARPWTAARTTRGAWRRGRRGRPARPRAAPCSRRAWRGRR